MAVAVADRATSGLARPAIAIELRTTTAVVEQGEQPQFLVEVVNLTDRAITLVQPGDGSESGWRTPIVHWLVEGVSSPAPFRSCGNINALTAAEVFTLGPGQRAALDRWLGGPTLPRPGKYKVRLRYENKPGQKWAGVPLGPHDVTAMIRVRCSTPAVADSNAVEIEVVK
jgi:hypothetical protein